MPRRRTINPMKPRRFHLAVLLALLASAALGQPLPSELRPAPPPLEPDPGDITALAVPDVDLLDGWLELTPLDGDAEPLLLRLPDRLAETPPTPPLHPRLPLGMTMLCVGGEPWAVDCKVVHRGLVGLGAPPEISLPLARGLEVVGTYVLDGLPVEDVRVSIAPADLAAGRPFTLPLRAPLGLVSREVSTGPDGRFTLPALAPGEYFLEALLPWGRLHRSDPFTVPEPDVAETGTALEDRVVWDVGTFEVAGGLVVEVRVTDPDENPLPGAVVTARQGIAIRSLTTYETRADAAGSAHLAGFTTDEPTVLGCSAPGFRARRFDFEVVPALVRCVLEPWAAVAGEVWSWSGEPIAPRVTITAVPLPPPLGAPQDDPLLDGLQAEPVAVSVEAASDGTFLLPELAAGGWRIEAAAPGLAIAEREILLDPGERLLLDPLVLEPGRALRGRVLSRQGEELAGVEIEAVEPPGAVRATTGVDGRFQVDIDPARRLRLAFRTPDMAPQEIVVDPAALEDDEELTVVMSPAGWILARVRTRVEGEDGPCVGCRILVRPTRGRAGEALPSTDRLPLTDSYGETTSGPLAPGVYRVIEPRVEHLGSTVVEDSEARWRLAEVVAGEVTEVLLGRSEESLRVDIDNLPDGLWVLSSRASSGRVERRPPEADGGYLLERRPGEDLLLTLHHFDLAAQAELQIELAWVPGAASPLTSVTLDGAAGGRATAIPISGNLETALYPARGTVGGRLVLKLPTTEIRGRAQTGRQPRVGARIRLLRIADRAVVARTATGPDGAFRLPHVAPGVYSLEIAGREVHFVSLLPGETVDLRRVEVPGGE